MAVDELSTRAPRKVASSSANAPMTSLRSRDEVDLIAVVLIVGVLSAGGVG